MLDDIYIHDKDARPCAPLKRVGRVGARGKVDGTNNSNFPFIPFSPVFEEGGEGRGLLLVAKLHQYMEKGEVYLIIS